ncbi:unnamed protein product [Brachionus calyciflorus]|uniref:R3H domain-containing protein n=1 Tax=Brachionus calyciflorus TaxID=104777 RepID=A0A814AIV6_9BILA|nr:unnamed protein product [Brachionus calyciflorus]
MSQLDIKESVGCSVPEQLVLGGDGKVVEIDESLFVRVKHGKGKDLKRGRVWVFGMYERGSRKCLFFVVHKCDGVNLLNIIYRHIAPNTIIHSDCWAAYNRIRLLNKNYIHLTRQNKFEDDDDDIIENLQPDLQDGDINDSAYEYLDCCAASGSKAIHNFDENLVCFEIESSCVYISDLNESSFISSIKDITQIKNREFESFTFRSCLSSEQRKIIHELCDLHGLKHETKGTRFKKLTITFSSIVVPYECDELSQKLSSIRLESVPRDNHVEDVINIPIKKKEAVQ